MFKGLLKLNANMSPSLHLHLIVKTSEITYQSIFYSNMFLAFFDAIGLLVNFFYSNMVFHQVIVTFLAFFDAIGIPGNLIMIVVIALETRCHVA